MKNMKFAIPILILIIYSSIASASVGEVAGYLYFNFTNVNQPIANHWTLVNTGNTAVNFNLIQPKYDNSVILITTNITNGTIPANSRQTILVTSELLQPANFNGMISALFPSGGNLNLQISKQIYINDLNKSQTPKNAAIITKKLNATTEAPATGQNSLANATTTVQTTASTTLLPATTLSTTAPATAVPQTRGITPVASDLLMGAGGLALAVTAIAVGIAYSKRGAKSNSKNRK
jgi:hypothetical protein